MDGLLDVTDINYGMEEIVTWAVIRVWSGPIVIARSSCGRQFRLPVWLPVAGDSSFAPS